MKFLVILATIFMCFSCVQEDQFPLKINGLWEVKKVRIEKEEMTPVARWMKFNADSTQTSGNGWLQHSIGTWSLNDKKQLTVSNSNGLLDESEPFLVDLQKDKMTWSRVEEGQNVQVFLERIAKIPTSDGNKLMGLWRLEKEKPTNDTDNSKIKTIYLSWDSRFIKQYKFGKKEYGIYKIHGHKPELQMVSYGESPEFKFYKFSISDDKLTLINTETKTKLIYSRIHKFLN